MTNKIGLIILLLVTFSLRLLAQDKQIAATYKGGKRGAGYVNITLKLYTDSTYEYKEWIHLGNYWNDSGRYQINDSLLILASIETKYNPNTRMSKNKEKVIKAIFNEDSFKIVNDTIFLYRTGNSMAFRKLLKVTSDRN